MKQGSVSTQIKTWRISGEMAAHRNEGANGTEAGQHPGLDGERNLWKEGEPRAASQGSSLQED